MTRVPEETRAWRSFPQGPGADRAVAGLAGRQHGQIAIHQLHELGLDGGWAQRRIRAGRLHRVHRGVYSVGHRRVDRPARWMAAVLAGGPAALLSHLSAAALWGLPVVDPDPVEITVQATGRRCRPGLRVHASTTLVPEDRARRRNIPVTSLSRTLLDLADALPKKGLARAFDDADRRRLLDPAALQRLLERTRGRHGVGPLRELLVRRTGLDVAGTRSDLEVVLQELCRGGDIPMPEINVIVAGVEVDAYWPDARLAVEADGFEFHRTRAAFERDHERDLLLQESGVEVMRLTKDLVKSQRERIIATIRGLRAARTRGGG